MRRNLYLGIGTGIAAEEAQQILSAQDESLQKLLECSAIHLDKVRRFTRHLIVRGHCSTSASVELVGAMDNLESLT